MCEYRVIYVNDAELGGEDFVICNEASDGVTCFMRLGTLSMPPTENAAVWERAWASFRLMAHVGDLPMQRDYYRSSVSAAP